MATFDPRLGIGPTQSAGPAPPIGRPERQFQPRPEQPSLLNRNMGAAIGVLGGPIGLGLGAIIDQKRERARKEEEAVRQSGNVQIGERRKAGLLQAARAYQIAGQSGTPLSFRELKKLAPDAGAIFGDTGIIGLQPVTDSSLAQLNADPRFAQLGLKAGDIIQHMFNGEVAVKTQAQVNGLIAALTDEGSTVVDSELRGKRTGRRIGRAKQTKLGRSDILFQEDKGTIAKGIGPTREQIKQGTIGTIKKPGGEIEPLSPELQARQDALAKAKGKGKGGKTLESRLVQVLADDGFQGRSQLVAEGNALGNEMIRQGIAADQDEALNAVSLLVVAAARAGYESLESYLRDQGATRELELLKASKRASPAAQNLRTAPQTAPAKEKDDEEGGLIKGAREIFNKLFG